MSEQGGVRDSHREDASATLVVVDASAIDEAIMLEERIYEFNVAATGIDDGRYLSVVLKRDDGTIYGGLHGHTWAASARSRRCGSRERAGEGARLASARRG